MKISIRGDSLRGRRGLFVVFVSPSFLVMIHFVDVERLYSTANEWNVERLFFLSFFSFLVPGLNCDEH
jgi:hypothetical protein